MAGDLNFLEDRCREILDGKRDWTREDYGADDDRFLVEVRNPLRQLEIRGLFEGREELKVPIDGNVPTVAVQITGAVNFAFSLSST